MLEIEISESGVATLALNRPDVLNALNGALIDALLNAVDRVKTAASARVLLLTGRGRAFCAGADLRDPMMGVGLPAEERGRRFLESTDRGIHALARALADLGKPRITAVNGAAVGGGASLALIADIVFAGRSAYFQQPFTPQLGLVPDLGGSWQLMRRLGPARAVATAMLGERISAEQAAAWGLIWQCVDDDELARVSTAAAERLAQGAPLAFAALPEVMSAALQNDFSSQLDCERDAQARLVQTEDFMEAVSAFREKRKPKFKGR
ncbi:enoyl-CoA hydratase-related protein [Ramlibacter tataouinensis]|uniref:enoyl-CoA hydratase-related protein n=1 Tax=Ramlibacter tataouinensis TaxID=94132 RepID=UPI0022F3F412|nr:enoyl-CoA hydratase-related protein [Ramlibacter tataouinensis]WBY02940.1 enoyl-CoA hydratase-related protein [Ramlibacter tataouinensis]